MIACLCSTCNALHASVELSSEQSTTSVGLQASTGSISPRAEPPVINYSVPDTLPCVHVRIRVGPLCLFVCLYTGR